MSGIGECTNQTLLQLSTQITNCGSPDMTKPVIPIETSIASKGRKKALNAKKWQKSRLFVLKFGGEGGGLHARMPPWLDSTHWAVCRRIFRQMLWDREEASPWRPPRESPPAGEGRRRFATAGRFLCSACFTGRKNLVFSPTGQASRIYVSPVCLNFVTNAISVPP